MTCWILEDNKFYSFPCIYIQNAHVWVCDHVQVFVFSLNCCQFEFLCAHVIKLRYWNSTVPKYSFDSKLYQYQRFIPCCEGFIASSALITSRIIIISYCFNVCYSSSPPPPLKVQLVFEFKALKFKGSRQRFSALLCACGYGWKSPGRSFIREFELKEPQTQWGGQWPGSTLVSLVSLAFRFTPGSAPHCRGWMFIACRLHYRYRHPTQWGFSGSSG